MMSLLLCLFRTILVFKMCLLCSPGDFWCSGCVTAACTTFGEFPVIDASLLVNLSTRVVTVELIA